MQTGEVIGGRYRLVAPLGRGAMGQVFEAHDERLQRRVAVKVVDLASATDPQVGERFNREAVATARLNHPNIVTIFDSGTQGPTAYLVMELLPGKPLSQVVRESGPLPVPDAIRIGGQVARALQATHAIGVVHRDVKPANIMIDKASVKLLDFGIAQVSLHAEANLTAPATTLGTAAYMSPEQARGQRATPASDMYALGAVLMVMLTGQPPFPGDSAIAVLSRQIHDPAPTVRSRRPDVPATLDDLVARLLAKDPLSRPDAAQVVAALDHLSHNVTGVAPAAATAVQPQFIAPVPVPVTAARPPATAVQETRRSPDPVAGPEVDPGRADASGYRRAATWIALVIAALLVVAVAWAFGSRFIAGVVAGGTSPSAEAKPSAEPAPVESAAPEPAPSTSIDLPEIPLPSISLPSVDDVALGVALEGVQPAIDTIDATRSEEAAEAQDHLTSSWADARSAVESGEGAVDALDEFESEVNAQEDAGAITFVEATTIRAAVSIVAAAI